MPPKTPEELQQQAEAPGQEGFLAGAVKGASEAVAGLAAEDSSVQPSENATGEIQTNPEPISAIEASRHRTNMGYRRSPGAKPPEVKQPPGDITMTGTIDTINTQGEQAIMAHADKMEQDYEYGMGLITMQEANASRDAMLQWRDIAANDYNARKQLINEAFPKWRRANEQLSQDIDDARRMKVNPYNYIQSVGRAGRVASVLSVGIGQLAAGAGNPNSVLMRLEAAINRDIAAQQANINQAWKGIEAKRQLTADEVGLLEQQFNFSDRAMAVGYAAIAAQMGAAKQHARSETANLNIQMIEERANAASAYYAGQARAKQATFMINSRINSAWGAMAKAKKFDELKRLVQAKADAGETFGVDAVEAGSNMGGPLTLQDGTVVQAGGQGQVPGTAQETPSTTPQGSVPAGQPAQPAATVGAAAVSRDRRKNRQNAPSQPTQGAGGPDLAAAPSNASTGQPGASTAEPTQTGETAAPRQTLAQQVGDKAVAEAGSWGRAQEIKDGFQPQGLTLDQMVAKVNDPTNVDYAVADHYQDAQVVAERLNPPNKEDKVFWGKNEKGEDELNQPAYDLAMRTWRNARNNPEVFMKPLKNINPNTGEEEEGRSNVLELSNGDYLMIKRDKNHLTGPNGSKARSELEATIEATYLAADNLVSAAQTWQQYGGTKSFMGLTIGPDGVSIKSLDARALAALKQMESTILTSGIQAIKSVDPQGRLSDQDVGFGRQMIAAMEDGVSISFDAISAMYASAFGKPGTLADIRLAAGKVFGAAVKNYLLRLDTQLGPDVVLSAQAQKSMQERADRVTSYPADAEATFERQMAEQDKAKSKEQATREALGVSGSFIDDITSMSPGKRIFAPQRALIRLGQDIYEKVTGDEETPAEDKTEKTEE